MEVVETLLANAGNKIRLVSGEGAAGTIETYGGERTVRAIEARLEKERCGGERWARALVFSHEGAFGDVFVNVETGEYWYC